MISVTNMFNLNVTEEKILQVEEFVTVFNRKVENDVYARQPPQCRALQECYQQMKRHYETVHDTCIKAPIK